ncbi:SDR family oxidoreductase [Brevundimonas sp. SL161]|uniref:SDR family oxidoreductase n=1 Tax=Brevundimonas sp. SL161 TaxID=2804613 RepID=UPI003CF47521
MTTGLSEKTCIVTGAGQGIGRAIAQALTDAGAMVIAVDLSRGPLTDWTSAAGVKSALVDVTDPAAVAQLAAQHPAASVLVNCVGVVATGTVLDSNAAELERSFRINVGSMANTIQAFLPAMLARRDGSIINIASVVSSIKAAPDRFVYATTKAAVIGLTKSVAMDFVGDGIRCNAICPGTVESPSLHQRMAAQPDPVAALAAFTARQPMGRIGQPEEIARIVVMLASGDADFMTGSAIVIDGGMSL